MIKDLLALWFQMTAAATQTVSQKAKEPPAPAALTQRFLMSSLRSKGRKLTPTGCTRSSGTMTPGRLVCLNKRMPRIDRTIFCVYLLNSCLTKY